MDLSLLTNLCGAGSFWAIVVIAAITSGVSLWLALSVRKTTCLQAVKPICFLPIAVGLFGTLSRLSAVLNSSLAVDDVAKSILYLEMILAPLVVASVFCIPAYVIASVGDFAINLGAEGYKLPKLYTIEIQRPDPDLEPARSSKGAATYDEVVQQLHRAESDW